MTRCPVCGAGNRTGSQSCSQCGAPFDAGDGSSRGGAPARHPGSRSDQPPSGPEPATAAPRDPSPSAARADEPPPKWLLAGAHDVHPGETLDWAADLDFSDLPEWENPGEIVAPGEPEMPSGETTNRSPGAQPAPGLEQNEPEGTGLLHGVRGPLLIEPIIALPHPSPHLPGDPAGLARPSSEAAALFAQIAAGTLPQRASVARAKRRPRPLPLNIFLLLAVVLPLVLRLDLTGPPAPEAASTYSGAIAGLSPGSVALVAFDYESDLADAVEPGVAATLQHLRSRNARIVALSTTPQGPALAQRLWRQQNPDGAGYGEDFANLGYLPAGELSLRALLADPLLAGQRDVVEQRSLHDLAIGREIGGIESIDLIVVASSDSRDVQRWIEQVGSRRPDLPLLAITTAAAEPVLAPYVAGGQLRGLLAGLEAMASYEEKLGASPVAGRRLDALAAAATLFVVVVALGNALALGERLRGKRGA